MKRIAAFLLVWVTLCLCVGTVRAEEDISFYLTAEKTEQGFRVAVCLDGVLEEHDVAGLRFRLSYPDSLVCEDWRIEEGLREFSLRQGPQYATSNPAIFLGVHTNGHVLCNGELASFSFVCGKQEVESIELFPEMMEIFTSETLDLMERVQTRGVRLSFSEASVEPLLPCEHEFGAWTVSMQDVACVRRVCRLCGLEQLRYYDEQAEESIEAGQGATLDVAESQMPEDVKVSLEPYQYEPGGAQTQAICEVLGTDLFSVVASYDLSITWKDEPLSLSEPAVLQLTAPAGVSEGDALTVALLTGGAGTFENVNCQEGSLRFAAQSSAQVYLLSDVRWAEQSGHVEQAGDEPKEEGELWIYALVAVVLLSVIVTTLLVGAKRSKSAPQTPANAVGPEPENEPEPETENEAETETET